MIYKNSSFIRLLHSVLCVLIVAFQANFKHFYKKIVSLFYLLQEDC